MVSICAGCNLYEPWAAGIVAIVAGIFYVFLSRLMLSFKVTLEKILSQLFQLFQIDDPLDAVAVHAGAGSWGLLAAPFFVQGGIFFGGGESALKMLMWNALAGGAIIVWYTVTAIVIFGALMVLRVFRVNEAQEIQGLDVVKHNEPAYPIGKQTDLDYP